MEYKNPSPIKENTEQKNMRCSIADSPPPREHYDNTTEEPEPFQHTITRSFGERYVLDEEEDKLSDADVEYIAIVRESFEGDEYSNKLFELMDNGTLSKSAFILQHTFYASSLCEKKMQFLEKMYAISSNIKN